MEEIKYIYRVNGEERMPTLEERKKMTARFVRALGFRPVQREKEEKKAAEE